MSMRRLLPILLLAGLALAQDKPVSMDVKGRTAKEVAGVLSGSYTKKKLVLDEELMARTLDLKVESVSREKALAMFAERIGAAIDRSQKGVIRLVPTWKHRLLEKLEKTQVHVLEWKKGDIVLAGALQYLRAITGVNIVLDPRVKSDLKVLVSAKQATAREILDLVCKQCDLAWAPRYGVAYIAAKKHLAAIPRTTPYVDHPLLRSRTVSLPFDRTSFPQASAYMLAASGIKFEITATTRDACEEVEISIRASGVTAGQAWALMLLPNGLTAEVKDKKLVIRAG